MNRLSLEEKKKILYDRIEGYKRLAVAYSGGVDSTLLLAVAARVLNSDAVAVTAVSPLQPTSEVQEAFKVARGLGVAHYRVDTREMAHDEFVLNDQNRCYVCKKIIFSDILKMTSSIGITAVAHAANVDDLNDFRPGMKAAEELDILSPLIDARMTKTDIRELSRQMGLPTWNKPAAACLASRIPYGTPISSGALEKIEAAENVLHALGFKGFRVRHYGEAAKIELRPSDFTRLLVPERRLTVISEFKRIGYTIITMDLEGYSQGSLNRAMRIPEEPAPVNAIFDKASNRKPD
ncbi:MAG: ATP-dependent sacrificial sulfur transferase LarE [Desulfosalsimonadaceae bacterium]